MEAVHKDRSAFSFWRYWPFKRLGPGLCYSVTPVTSLQRKSCKQMRWEKARPLCETRVPLEMISRLAEYISVVRMKTCERALVMQTGRRSSAFSNIDSIKPSDLFQIHRLCFQSEAVLGLIMLTGSKTTFKVRQLVPDMKVSLNNNIDPSFIQKLIMGFSFLCRLSII